MRDLTPPSGDLEPIERASADELHALQLERLQWTLRHAYANVPHYRAAFDAGGVRPDDCKGLADLTKFPLTSKADRVQGRPAGDVVVAEPEHLCHAAHLKVAGTICRRARDGTECPSPSP